MPARPLFLAATLLATTLGAQQRPPATPQRSLCSIHQLTLTIDRGEGEFEGMQQSGALLVLRNISQNACSVQPIPTITLFAKDDKPLVVAARLRVLGMHPGPVVFPIPIAAGAVLTATMHWITGPVFDHNVFAKPHSLSLTIEGQEKRVPFRADICGERGKRITYSITPFAPDPTYKPAALNATAAPPPPLSSSH